MIASPSEHDIRHAMARALEATLRRYDGQPYSQAALLERVTAMPGRLEHLGDDWWCIGQIIDTIAGVEIAVQCRPARLRVSEIPSQWLDPGPPSFIADGETPIGPARYWQKADKID